MALKGHASQLQNLQCRQCQSAVIDLKTPEPSETTRTSTNGMCSQHWLLGFSHYRTVCVCVSVCIPYQQNTHLHIVLFPKYFGQSWTDLIRLHYCTCPTFPLCDWTQGQEVNKSGHFTSCLRLSPRCLCVSLSQPSSPGLPTRSLWSMDPGPEGAVPCHRWGLNIASCESITMTLTPHGLKDSTHTRTPT